MNNTRDPVQCLARGGKLHSLPSPTAPPFGIYVLMAVMTGYSHPEIHFSHIRRVSSRLNSIKEIILNLYF